MSDALTKLAGVLGMMGSTHDGEILNAARLAERLRKQMNKSWTDIIVHSSSSSSGDAMIWRGRAMRAEMRMLALETRIVALEKELQAARAARETTNAGSTGFQPNTRPTKLNFKISKEIEDRLVERLQRRSASSATIYEMTGWPKPSHLHSVLTAMAAKHGLRMTSTGRGYYRFVPL